MAEFLISNRDFGKRVKGDIICVRPDGFKWSQSELLRVVKKAGIAYDTAKEYERPDDEYYAVPNIILEDFKTEGEIKTIIKDTPKADDSYIAYHNSDYIHNDYYNCLAEGCTLGFDKAGTNGNNCTAYNCVAFNNTTDFDTVDWTLDYISSDDDRSGDVVTSWTNISPGGTEADDWNDAFTDYANNDYSLKQGSVLIGVGTDDPSSGLYSDDIIGATRTTTWDIGPHEFATKNYTKEGVALPADDTDLAVTLTQAQRTTIGTSDNSRVSQTAYGVPAIFLFKKRPASVNDVAYTVTWEGQSNIAPSSSTVYLQVYNMVSPGWETIATDSATGANTDFTLTENMPTAGDTMSDYFDANGWISCRVYQDIP